MNDWNKLLEDLEQDGPLEPDRVNTLKERLKQESELRQKKWLFAGTLYCLLGMGILWLGGTWIRDIDETRMMLMGVVLMIIGFEITVLAKLAYGGLFSGNKMVETVREVQISVIEHLRVSEKHSDEGTSHDKAT